MGNFPLLSISLVGSDDVAVADFIKNLHTLDIANFFHFALDFLTEIVRILKNNIVNAVRKGIDVLSLSGRSGELVVKLGDDNLMVTASIFPQRLHILLIQFRSISLEIRILDCDTFCLGPVRA